MPLRDPEQWQLLDLLVGNLDGTPGDELLAIYRATADETIRAYDLLSWKR
jgi:hypothetical protein